MAKASWLDKTTAPEDQVAQTCTTQPLLWTGLNRAVKTDTGGYVTGM